MFDDFDVQIQSDEIIGEEYEDWLEGSFPNRRKKETKLY